MRIEFVKYYKLKLSLKQVFFIIFILLISYYTFSQNFYTNKIYNKAVSIDTTTSLDPKQKYKALQNLKKQIEADNQTNDTGYAFTLIKLAKYQYNITHNTDSAIWYTQLATQLNRHCNHNGSQIILINALYNIAYYYQYNLQYNLALSYYDSVLQECRKKDLEDYVILSKYNRTQIYFDLGDYQKATEESTAGIKESTNRHDSTHYAALLNFRAYSFLFQNNLRLALTDVNAAISIAKSANDSFRLAELYETRGLIYQNTKTYDLAETYFKLAIITRPVSAFKYETTAIDYINLGILYSLNHKSFKKAKYNYRKAIAISKNFDFFDRMQTLFLGYLNIAIVAAKQHNYKEAIINYNLAMASIHIKTNNFLLSPIYTSKLEIVGYKEVIFSFLFSKTELLLQLFKQTHNQLYLQACLQTAKTTDTLITKTRHENLRENSKLFWRNETRSFFNNVIEACYLAKDANKAFYFMEKSRAALLNDKWNELGANTNLPQAETDRQEYLQTKIIEQREQLSSLQPSAKQYDSTENNLLQTVDSLEHFIKSLENKYPAYYQYKYADDVPSLQALQQYLAKNNQSFVYYFMNDTSMYALGITKNKTNFIKINATDFNSHQLSSFIGLCSDKKRMMNNYPAYASLSQTIYKKLFLPLQIPKGNVAICTDNFFIPFEALCTDEKGKNFLLYNYNFSYAYSARSLLKTFTYSKPTGNFIGFAPVSFSSSLGVFDLKQSAVALQNVANFYSQNTLLTQQEATRKSFFEKASHYSVVTIFSHAQADTTDKEPVLYMQDSLIHLSDLQRLNNPAIQFVLLSACQTNIGKNATGEGIYSLARGFASAGIPSVSATLWKADEGAVYQISTKFNEYLSKGANKSEALQKAKIWYLQNNENKENSLPYYWANMVLIGSSQPVVLASSNHLWIWITSVIFFIILLSLMAYVFYKKKNARKVLNNVV